MVGKVARWPAGAIAAAAQDGFYMLAPAGGRKKGAAWRLPG
jgi:hypothetical protein